MNLQNQILSYLISDALKKLRKNQHVLVDKFLLLQKDLREKRVDNILAWHELFVRCHELYGELGGALTADHWQSPSFGGSCVDESGDESGKIIANLNDYKRDQHAIGIAYEQAYARAYLLHSFMETPTAFATTSGMAALTVAALVVRQRLPDDYRIAVGRHSYFENHELFRMVFSDKRIVMFDENQPKSLRPISPHAIFFDSEANDPSMMVADAKGIFSVAGKLDHHVDIVVDATCVSMVHFRIPVVARIRGNVSVIACESLNKYHQFGLDRTTGGILWAYRILNDTIYRVRDHAGVNILELAAATLPTPNLKLHKKYLKRLRENALHITTILKHQPNVKVRGGPFVALEFPGHSWKYYKTVVESILTGAKKQHVPIIVGSTFGTPITRIYTWSPRSQFEKTFLRISPGLESPDELARVCDVLIEALS